MLRKWDLKSTLVQTINTVSYTPFASHLQALTMAGGLSCHLNTHSKHHMFDPWWHMCNITEMYWETALPPHCTDLVYSSYDTLVKLANTVAVCHAVFSKHLTWFCIKILDLDELTERRTPLSKPFPCFLPKLCCPAAQIPPNFTPSKARRGMLMPSSRHWKPSIFHKWLAFFCSFSTVIAI